MAKSIKSMEIQARNKNKARNMLKKAINHVIKGKKEKKKKKKKQDKCQGKIQMPLGVDNSQKATSTPPNPKSKMQNQGEEDQV